MMNYFVNGRYIKSPILANATMQGYQGFLMGHRYPFVVLMLSIDSSFIDVNVHPTKMEIRFTNQMEVLSLVRDTVTEALKQSTLIPDVTLDEKEKQSPVEEKPIEKQPYLAETDAPQGAVRTKIQCWTGESHKTQMCRLRTDRRGRSESGVPFLLQM